jgi:hypothetical protein
LTRCIEGNALAGASVAPNFVAPAVSGRDSLATSMTNLDQDVDQYFLHQVNDAARRTLLMRGRQQQDGR